MAIQCQQAGLKDPSKAYSFINTLAGLSLSNAFQPIALVKLNTPHLNELAHVLAWESNSKHDYNKH